MRLFIDQDDHRSMIQDAEQVYRISVFRAIERKEKESECRSKLSQEHGHWSPDPSVAEERICLSASLLIAFAEMLSEFAMISVCR
ncbi:MAG TPA: hypothetical protein VK578_02810 [Edaphobacter sp.]|nr:hypothetical protein [Edaphobacter sp.]